jgi:poly(3-hydroxybutyrate) depolymerase
MIRPIHSVSAAATVLAALASAALAQNGKLPDFKPGRSDIVFKESAPQCDKLELKLRFRASDAIPDYDVAREKYQVVVPKEYTHAAAYGLFIWINPGDGAGLPGGWEAVLARHKFIGISAYKSGNPRNAFDRFRLAIDAAFNMPKRFNIDAKRVYVSGFSGGGRISSMLGVSYADIFTGMIPVCGVNFYKNVPIGNGKVFGLSYIPPDEALEIAKRNSRIMLITGEKDFNRENTKVMFDNGFKVEGFKSVQYVEVPGLAHAPCPAEWLDKALAMMEK